MYRTRREICTTFWVKIPADDSSKYFSQKIGYDVSYKLSPKETVCKKCQILFPWKNKKNINLSSTKSAHRVIKVKLLGAMAG